jgi:DNA-binding PadR family transcriptional regulator
MIPDTRYAILGLLARKPSHGYELATSFDELFGPGSKINVGQVSDILSAFRETGWAECMPSRRGRRELKIHQITHAGDQALTDWHTEPCGGTPFQRETFYLKLALARPQDAPHLLESIALREQACVDLLRHYANDASHVPEEADEWETLTRGTIDEAASIRYQGELDLLSKTRKRIERFLKRLQDLTGIAGDQILRPNGSAAA